MFICLKSLRAMTLFVKQVTIKKPFMKPNKNKFGDISSCFGLVEMQKRSLTIKVRQQIDVIQDDNQIKFEPANDQYFGSELHTHQTWDLQKKKTSRLLRPPIAITCNENMNFIYGKSFCLSSATLLVALII